MHKKFGITFTKFPHAQLPSHPNWDNKNPELSRLVTKDKLQRKNVLTKV